MIVTYVYNVFSFLNVLTLDHDECLNHIDDCDHKCHNIRGGYSCSCYEGFRLRGDSGTCDG